MIHLKFKYLPDYKDIDLSSLDQISSEFVKVILHLPSRIKQWFVFYNKV